jgi:hypothetical protein
MLALVLQVIPEEIPAAEELINLITDIEPVPRKDCEFILFTRRDVESVDARRLVSRLQTKFPRAKQVECWDFATGWPHGPNTMWCSLIRQMYHMHRMDETASDGFLSFEADCIPIKTNWISALSRAWDEARKEGKEACGHFHGPDHQAPSHMNGNAIFDTDFWHKHEELTGCHGMQPWDVAFAPTILKVAVDTPAINQWYRMGSFTDADWDYISKTACALFHGVKVPDGRRIAREQLVLKQSWPTTPVQTPETGIRTSHKRSKRSKAKLPSSSSK